MQGHGTCNDCNKKFCLAYNLPICKNVNEDDVFTTCFRKHIHGETRNVFWVLTTLERDSAKDEAVVFVFIFATVGLLVYAAIRPFVERWMEVSLLPLAPCYHCFANLHRTIENDKVMPQYHLQAPRNRNAQYSSWM